MHKSVLLLFPYSMKMLHKSQIKKTNKNSIVLGIIALTIIAVFWGLKLGFISLAWDDLIKVGYYLLGIADDNSVNPDIVDVALELRLPRILLAACVGMGLTLSGIIMQAVVRNPLADPYILGVSSGASLGATLAIFFGVGSFFGAQFIGICAFIGAFGVSLLVAFVSNLSGFKTSSGLLLSGMAISAICASFSSLVAYVGRNKEGMEAITYWLMGSVANARLENVLVLMLVIMILFAFFLTQTRNMNIMLQGYEAAMTLGLDIRKLKNQYLLLNGLLVGFIVFNSGMIGFIGLIIPHLVRLIFGSNHNNLLPIAVAFGGLIAVFMDIVSRTIIRGIDIPLGVIFALLGAPCFIYLLIKQNYRFGAEP
ncbi:MAG: FecCD family ABC transporter permease [Phascolarctobacterium sp.]